MNNSLRTRVFEFAKDSPTRSKLPVKSPCQARTRTQVSLSKLRFSIEYDHHIKAPKNLSNFGISIGIVAHKQKESSKFSICELKDLEQPIKTARVKDDHIYFRNTFMDKHKKNLSLFNSKQTAAQSFRTINPTQNSSVRNIVNQLWSKSPVKDGKVSILNWKNNKIDNINHGLVLFEDRKNNYNKKEDNKYEVSQNCVSIQTDEV
jgi:hypothetical protein